MKIIKLITLSLALFIAAIGEGSVDSANLYAKDGRYPEALQTLNALIAENPNSARAYKIRAHVYYAMGDYTNSMRDAQQVVALAPNNPLPYIERAIIHSVTGNHNAALADVDHALSLKPSSVYAQEVRREIIDRAKKK